MIYDSNRQRLVLFGGVDGSQSFGDVWQLPLGGPSLTWGRLAPDGTSPSPRYGALALFDPVGDRMLVSGGWDQGITQPQVRRLQWSMSPTPTALALESFEAQPDLVRLSWDVPSGASSFVLERRVPAGSWVECSAEREASVPLTLVDHTVTAASRYGYRLLAFSGAGVTTSAEVWLETPPPISLTLDGFVPNPVARSPRVRFTAAAHMRARIEILDVTGRRRAAREIEAGGSGGQTIEFPGVALSPGVYLVRLRAEGITLVRRGIVVR